MKQTITSRPSKIIPTLIFFLCFFKVSCRDEQKLPGVQGVDSRKVETTGISSFKEKIKGFPIVTLANSSGRLFTVYVAKSRSEQTQGLSGIQDNEFSDQEGMIFYYEKDQPHSFWMPDTYFDLDIFFLTQDLKILAVERSVPFHPGYESPPAIATTRNIYSRHVLELKSSDISRSLKEGDSLILQSGTL